jgi:hypothetical protein
MASYLREEMEENAMMFWDEDMRFLDVENFVKNLRDPLRYPPVWSRSGKNEVRPSFSPHSLGLRVVQVLDNGKMLTPIQ